MIRAVLALALALCSLPAAAQNILCPTRAIGDTSNACASTQFVQQNLSSGTNLSASIDAAFGSTRGSILERGASLWQTIPPGATTGFPWVSNGVGADPSYQTLTGTGISSGTVTNSNLANMAAKTVKSNITAGSAAPVDNTTLPNPFSAGTSLYPTLNGFQFDTNSAFGANTLASKNVLVGVPAATVSCCTWLNTYLPGVDSTGVTANYVIHPGSTGSLWPFVTAARSSDSSSVGVQNIIPDNSINVHDNTTVGHQNWGRYTAAYVTSGAAHGRSIGHEISVFNTGTASTVPDPFTANPAVPSSDGVRVDCAAGGGFGGSDCGVAFNIINNGGKFGSGLICNSSALSTASTANPDCIALPPTFSQTWYSAAATKIWQLIFAGGANGNLNLTTGGTGAFAVTALNETTGQAYNTSFTPVLSCGTGTITSSTPTARYRQLGKTIHVLLNLAITTLGTCATTISATLPFTAAGGGSVGSGRDTGVGGKMLSATVVGGTASAQIFNYDNTFPAASGSNFVISIVFERN